jgi:hypothetical protein
MAVSENEFIWREWILGEERFAGKGPRSMPRPHVGFGGPGEKPVPPEWWRRLEKFLVQRHDSHEINGDRPVVAPPKRLSRAKTGQMSPHFNVREFDCHDGRRVPTIAEPALRRLCLNYLEPVRTVFGPVKILSGYRPKDYNARIGGAKFSQHIYELTPGSVASDFTCAHGSPAEWYRFLDNLGPGGLGRYPGFVHVDNRPGKARWSG